MSAEPAIGIAADEFQLQQREVSKQLAAPVLDGYETIAYIGEGTYGDVWQARDLKTGTIVAIKRLRKQPDQRSKGEVRMLAGLDEVRGIVALKGIHLDSEPYCYVMEFIAGGTLAELLNRRGKLPFSEAWPIFRQIAEALSYVHRHGAVHCDLKPQNVLLDSRGAPRLTDFGQARGQGPRGSSVGTRFYMPPEQARLDPPDARWDVYALGAVLYQMLTGTKPRFSPQLSDELRGRTQTASEMRDQLEQYAQHLVRAEPPQAHRSLPGVTTDVAQLIERCLSTDIDRRPADGTDVLRLIQRCEWRRRRRPLLVLGGIAPALTLLAAGLIVIFGGMLALKKFERRWVAQVIADNQVIARTIAAELEGRFNDRLRVVRQAAADPQWPDLLAPSPDSEMKNHLFGKLEELYRGHAEQRLRRWSIAPADGAWQLTYGKLPSGNEGADEFQAADAKPLQISNAPRLTGPHRRRSSDPKNEIWVLSVVCGAAPGSDAAPRGELSAEVDYREFNDAFARFESSAVFQRKVIVADERGQILYHRRFAEQRKQSEAAAVVPVIDLTQSQNVFFAPGFAETLPVSRPDPWYRDADRTNYYFSGNVASLANGQKMTVLVLHDEQTALAGFIDTERSARLLGIGLLAVGCVMLAGNWWILRRTLREEGATDRA